MCTLSLRCVSVLKRKSRIRSPAYFRIRDMILLGIFRLPFYHILIKFQFKHLF
jgi:hypothetical protein